MRQYASGTPLPVRCPDPGVDDVVVRVTRLWISNDTEGSYLCGERILVTHSLPLSRYRKGIELLRSKTAVKVCFLPWDQAA